MITKKELRDGSYYRGSSRNATIARWLEKHNCFIYKHGMFGGYFLEKINHPEDEDTWDVFQPEEEVDKYVIKEAPEERIDIREIRKFLGECPYFFFDSETQKEVTPEMVQIIEESFPTECYGEDILNFEAWPLRKILLQAMVMGAWLEKNKGGVIFSPFKDSLSKIKNQEIDPKELEGLPED